MKAMKRSMKPMPIIVNKSEDESPSNALEIFGNPAIAAGKTIRPIVTRAIIPVSIATLDCNEQEKNR